MRGLFQVNTISMFKGVFNDPFIGCFINEISSMDTKTEKCPNQVWVLPKWNEALHFVVNLHIKWV